MRALKLSAAALTAYCAVFFPISLVIDKMITGSIGLPLRPGFFFSGMTLPFSLLLELMK